MRILVAASEMVPFVKTGGLGDVLGALPRAMAREGHDVKVFIPHYQSLNTDGFRLKPLDWSLEVPVGNRSVPMTVTTATDNRSGLQTCFVANPRFFHRRGLYSDPETNADFTDNDERFVFFCRSVLEAARKIGFRPDIVHVHDWQAGLIPVFLKTAYADDPFFAGVKSVLTIHNLAHQGVFKKERYVSLGLPDEMFAAMAPFEFYGKVNFLKAAIIHADRITTVSPRYAREIQTGRFGCGLEGVLRRRVADLTGILNGVDYTVWSPSRDNHIPYRYHPANLGGKKKTKIEVLGAAGLPIREKTPLIGMISRLVQQKGLDLIRDAADRLFAMNIQMLVLGTGGEQYHKLFERLEKKYPDKMKAYLVLDEELAHKIEAAADIFLMPSLFEPCGLNQMYSLKYGAVPVVHEVGGLADTIEDYDQDAKTGNGFVFREETPEALLSAVQRAVAAFSRRQAWTKIVKAGMRQDFSWGNAVSRYLELFERVVNS